MSAEASEFERLVAAAEVLCNERRPREAEPPAAAALAIGERWGDAAGAEVARAALALADVRVELGAFSEAEALSRRALRALDQPGVVDEAVAGRLRVRALCAVGSALRCQGRYRDAEQPLREALELAERRFGNDDLAVGEAANNLAVLYKYTARFDEAERLYRRALQIVEAGNGGDDLKATLWHNLGGLEHSRGRNALAEPAARRAVEIRTRALGADHPVVAADAAALAAVLDALGLTDEAEALFRQALDTFRRLLGPRNYEVAINANNLAALHYRRGDHEQARALWELALDIKRELLGLGHPEVATTIVNLGVLAAKSGDNDHARSLFEQALQILGPEVGADHPVRKAATANHANLDELDDPAPAASRP